MQRICGRRRQGNSFITMRELCDPALILGRTQWRRLRRR
jgi:hypothetical protein